MAKLTGERFANVAYGNVTMSAANTLTFAQIVMGVGIFQKTAMILHRLEWFPTWASLKEIVAATDYLTFALVTSNRLSAISDITDPAVIVRRSIYGIGVAVEPAHLPIVTDFGSMPSGGILMSPNPLYVAAITSGAAAASQVTMKMWFTFIEMSDAEYLELLQTTYPANVA